MAKPWTHITVAKKIVKILNNKNMFFSALIFLHLTSLGDNFTPSSFTKFDSLIFIPLDRKHSDELIIVSKYNTGKSLYLSVEFSNLINQNSSNAIFLNRNDSLFIYNDCGVNKNSFIFLDKLTKNSNFISKQACSQALICGVFYQRDSYEDSILKKTLFSYQIDLSFGISVFKCISSLTIDKNLDIYYYDFYDGESNITYRRKVR